ncbi:MAG: 1-acyl-sn-glycerol-3-phosphate acyltransferase [Chloroflexi bacterium]|nr:1-acyl-sn-glycerol-3-phosphate acyltransferase [Chloroflexota bacterium]
MSNASLRQRLYVKMIAAIFGAYFRMYHRLKFEGLEYVPTRGPLLIALNHTSNLEPFALGVALVERGIVPGVDMWTVSKKELFKRSWLARLLGSVGMFPIDRENINMSAMRMMVRVLTDGKILALAPEGTRSPTGKLQLFQPVIAKIVITRRVPILPVGVEGADKALSTQSKIPRPVPITLRFGPVFELREFYDAPLTDEMVERAAWAMREHVAALLPERMRELPPYSGRVGARKV